MKNGASAPLLDADPGVKDVAMVPASEAPSDASGLAVVIQQLAANPNVDVDKLERIIEMQKDIMRTQALMAFDSAYAEMRPHIPQIDEKGQIIVKGTLRSTYSRLEDIDAVITPIISKFGFAIRHRTEFPADKPGIIRIVGILTHKHGHREESVFEAPSDKSDFRTDVQSMGSTVSYGRRYSTLDLLNIVTRKADDDGQSAGRPQPPEGYDKWWRALESVAEGGLKALEHAWDETKGPQGADYKTFTIRHNKPAHEALKEKAQRVKGGR